MNRSVAVVEVVERPRKAVDLIDRGNGIRLNRGTAEP